jgi:sporulation protein YlmC with PRC-barrel domain
MLAKDGEIGKVFDVLVDDETWRVRYLVGDTGGWLSGKHVLLAPPLVGPLQGEAMPVALTRAEIENSPEIDVQKPVSAQREEEIAAHYGWTPYWIAMGTAGAPPALPESWPGPFPGPLDADDQRTPRSGGDPHLRSAREVRGYRLQGSDGPVGKVSDLLIDEDEWTVRYLVVDTGRWLPGRKVILSPAWVLEVRWADQIVRVDLERERIGNSPEYQAGKPVDREYEARLHDYFARPRYWRERGE